MEKVVKVWDRDATVSVDRRSKTVWIATGEYMGHRIETKGQSANTALALWRDAAKYKGG